MGQNFVVIVFNQREFSNVILSMSNRDAKRCRVGTSCCLSADASQCVPTGGASLWLLTGIALVCLSQVVIAAEHWAFTRGKKPALPEVSYLQHIRNPVDRFVVSKLETEGIKPSEPAQRATLIRRLSLDLLGLPPAPVDVIAFMADNSPDAYSQLVDRLLASPHFGERWGRHWLDLARYADSDGYLGDNLRPYAWVYRDWVIKAINADMPFDRFTVEQLAGDLLLNPTKEQLIAVGFHRNTLKNTEAGADRELNRAKEVVDRVNTTGTVWLGLTVACAECHDHKHDPISQAEFYELYSFFNNTDEVSHSAPQPLEMRRFELAKTGWDRKLARLKAPVEKFESERLPGRFLAWLKKQKRPKTKWTVMKPDLATGYGEMAVQKDGSVIAEGKNISTVTYSLHVSNSPPRTVNAIRLELFGEYGREDKTGGAVGRGANGQVIVSSLAFAVVPPGTKGFGQPLESVEVTGGFGEKDALNSGTNPGWSITNHTRRYYSAVFKLRKPAVVPKGARLLFAMRQKEGKYNAMRHLRISVTDEDDPEPTVIPDEVAYLVGENAFKRVAEDWERLQHHYCQLDDEWVRLRKPLEYHLTRRPSKPTTKAQSMAERKKDRRKSFVHIRGDYSRAGVEVDAGTPAALHAFKSRGESADRLDLARWLTGPDNPITARVTVNRIWQRLFGVGIVESSDDFGTMGARPTHPKLLDWLAAELEGRDWSRKEIIRMIVMSATYRQSSASRPELANHPTGNRLLWRQNSFRLSAETVRDVHLAASGLYDTAIGGPGIRPPLPAFVTEVGRSVKWPVSTGGERYRRGMYIFFKRTVPYPMLISFDAPDSSVSCSRRERTNSPLQALTLLNDPAFFECAEVLGKQYAGRESKGAIREMFLRCLSREPSDRELDALIATHVDLKATRSIDPMIGIARIVMNLDEFITRD